MVGVSLVLAPAAAINLLLNSRSFSLLVSYLLSYVSTDGIHNSLSIHLLSCIVVACFCSATLSDLKGAIPEACYPINERMSFQEIGSPGLSNGSVSRGLAEVGIYARRDL